MEGAGIPVGLAVEGANRNDMKMVRNTLESIPIERPEPTEADPQGMCMDKGYDFDEVRAIVAEFAFTAHIHDIDAFNIYMAAFFTVMLICGAWFPVDVLPVWLRWIAYAIPLTESIDLTRALLTGRFLSRHVYEAAYLVISAVVACEWAMRSLRKRMVA